MSGDLQLVAVCLLQDEECHAYLSEISMSTTA